MIKYKTFSILKYPIFTIDFSHWGEMGKLLVNKKIYSVLIITKNKEYFTVYSFNYKYILSANIKYWVIEF